MTPLRPTEYLRASAAVIALAITAAPGGAQQVAASDIDQMMAVIEGAAGPDRRHARGTRRPEVPERTVAAAPARPTPPPHALDHFDGAVGPVPIHVGKRIGIIDHAADHLGVLLPERDLSLDRTLHHIAADAGLAGLDGALADLELLLGQPQHLVLDVAQRAVLGEQPGAAGLDVDRPVLGQYPFGPRRLVIAVYPHGQDRAASLPPARLSPR